MQQIRIALSGKIASGKTALAHYVVETYGFTQLSLAFRLKQLATELFQQQGKNRALLQALGERMRQIDEHVWIRYVVKQIPPDKNVIISDVRYKNEADTLRELGFKLIRLVITPEEQERRIQKLYPNLARELLSHVSEIELDSYAFDYVLDADLGQKELIACIDEIIAELSLEQNND
jgi:dephospho-CoA kinase